VQVADKIIRILCNLAAISNALRPNVQRGFSPLRRSQAGQILISPRVLMAVEDAVTVEPAGEFSLKGIRRPPAAYKVLASKAAN